MNDLNIQYPWALMLMLLIPIVLKLRKKHAPVLKFSGVLFLTKQVEAPFLKQHGEELLLTAVMTLLVFAIANIQYFWHRKIKEIERLYFSHGKPQKVMVNPPSTVNTCQVIYEASEPARKKATPAISSGLPARLRGR